MLPERARVASFPRPGYSGIAKYPEESRKDDATVPTVVIMGKWMENLGSWKEREFEVRELQSFMLGILGGVPRDLEQCNRDAAPTRRLRAITAPIGRLENE